MAQVVLGKEKLRTVCNYASHANHMDENARPKDRDRNRLTFKFQEWWGHLNIEGSSIFPAWNENNGNGIWNDRIGKSTWDEKQFD
jgi:hypothetical protein